MIVLCIIGALVGAWLVGVLTWGFALIRSRHWDPAPAFVIALLWPIAWPAFLSWVRD